MKRIGILTAAGIFGMLSVTANVQAADYTVAAPDAGIFGKPTSVQTAVVGDNINPAAVDQSKNSARIPPGFGSPTSNLRGSGAPLTPNLASNYTNPATGEVMTGNVTVNAGQPAVTVSSIQPSGNVTTSYGTSVIMPPQFIRPEDEYYYEEEAFTDVTDSMYYSAGHIGTLQIPELDLTVRVYEGTADSALAKGAGHFKETSIWNGNVCLAAHNRGVNDYFGEIHTLDYGDRIKLTTKKGTRTYRVYNVEKISVYDTSHLQGTSDNILTLITCVRNQSNYRWCVQARAD